MQRMGIKNDKRQKRVKKITDKESLSKFVHKHERVVSCYILRGIGVPHDLYFPCAAA